jgi:beta-lactamase regulating signal transducer with metallopeptidase domain
MPGGDLLIVLLKHTLAVLLVLLALRALRHASAARRVFAARCGMLVLLLVPALSLLVPEGAALRVRLPHAVTAALEPETTLPALAWLASAPVRAEAFAAPARAAQAGRVLLFLYASGVLLLLLHTCAGLLRLRGIARRSRTLAAPAWTAALARLRAELGIAREVRLLVSDEVGSPLSWGLRKPLIVLDPRSVATAAPEAVIAHELAHIARRDWPVLLGARVLVALYWWHPLMHLLFRNLQEDTECAADDAVLGAGVPASDYAHTLLTVSRHAFGGSNLATQIAARGNALVQRIGALLQAGRARGRVSRVQWLLGSALTLILILLLGAMVQRGEHVVWPDSLLSAPATVSAGSAPQLLDAIDNPNFRQLAMAMRAQDFTQRHAPGGVSFRQRAAIPALVMALQDKSPVVRRLAAWGLSEMRFPETAPALAALLADPVPEVRAEAAGALGDMGETRWLPAMLAMLRDADPGVRARVAHVLGDLALPATAPALRALLRDADPDVAAEARWALDELE